MFCNNISLKLFFFLLTNFSDSSWKKTLKLSLVGNSRNRLPHYDAAAPMFACWHGNNEVMLSSWSLHTGIYGSAFASTDQRILHLLVF